MSPIPAAGSLFRRPLIPLTAITNKFLPPVLSAQFMTAPTGRPRAMRNFPPAEPPLPVKHEENGQFSGEDKSPHFPILLAPPNMLRWCLLLSSSEYTFSNSSSRYTLHFYFSFSSYSFHRLMLLACLFWFSPATFVYKTIFKCY